MKKKSVVLLVIVFISIIAVFIVYKPVIFQCGNPIPYISKMFSLNGNANFSRVFDEEEVFLTKRYDIYGINSYIEDTYNVSFVEQMGSAYIFKSTDKTVIAETELYWKYYQVWEISECRN